ncbi:MAG TPA: glycosyltransferase family 87 protein [Candidatus Sulfotelmatobacter sp.]|jgi:hypothetical protein|nr:glycosyltransferase family 87 protein [Candidatus Sulfotelmatobacter sp.]
MKTRIWLLLSVLAAGTTWLYVGKVLTPWNQHRGEVIDRIKNQMGDLYSPWVGTRELLLHHRNPYSPEVSHEIQMVFYGHAVNQTYAQSAATSAAPIINEQRFAYPVYTVFLLAPTVYAEFADVRAVTQLAFALLTAISVLLCLDILHWRLPWKTAAALILFTLSSPQIVQGLRFEQLAVVVGFLIVAGAWCVSKHHFTIAGILLALSTIKPQMALLPLCCFAIWTVGDWHKRWRLAASFLITLTALIAAGELLLPGWLGYFLVGIAAYRKYAPTSSLLSMALGDTLGEILGGIIILALLFVAWRNRKYAADSEQFTATLAAFLIGAILAFPLFTPFNQVMLILPAMLLIKNWGNLPRISRVVFTVSVIWPWIVSLVLLLSPPRLDSPSQLPLLPSFVIVFFPFFLPLLLMTRRTPASRPQITDFRPS